MALALSSKSSIRPSKDPPTHDDRAAATQCPIRGCGSQVTGLTPVSYRGGKTGLVAESGGRSDSGCAREIRGGIVVALKRRGPEAAAALRGDRGWR